MQAQQKEFGRVLSTREAAEYMNVSEAEILSWIDSGKLAVRFSNGEVRLYAVSDRDFFQMVCGLLAGRPEDERIRIREACGWR